MIRITQMIIMIMITEVLSNVLLLSQVEVAVRLRPLCGAMRSAIDENSGPTTITILPLL